MSFQKNPKPIKDNTLSLFQIIIVVVICLLIDLIMVVSIAFFAGWIADTIYTMRHIGLDSIRSEKDLGLGLVVVFWAGMSLLFSIPFSMVTFNKFFLIISKMWSKN